MWIMGKFLFVGLAILFWFQNSTSNSAAAPKMAATSPAKGASDTAPGVALTQAVITVHGACDASKEASTCTTTISREQFENLVRALHPGQDLAKNARNNLAKLYGEYMTIETAARKADMEDTAEFHEFMNWMRVLAASEYYRRKLQEKYSTPSQEEIDAYYHEHLAEYETARLARILVPRENRAIPTKDEFDKKAHEVAETTRAEAAKGIDPTAAQRHAYEALGLSGPPPVDVGTLRRKDFSADEATEIFSLKPGEVTKVQTEPKNYIIYKILSRETKSEEDLKKSISGQITEKKFRETMKALVDRAPIDLNEQYFGPPGAADNEPPRSPHTFVAH